MVKCVLWQLVSRWLLAWIADRCLRVYMKCTQTVHCKMVLLFLSCTALRLRFRLVSPARIYITCLRGFHHFSSFFLIYFFTFSPQWCPCRLRCWHKSRIFPQFVYLRTHKSHPGFYTQPYSTFSDDYHSELLHGNPALKWSYCTITARNHYWH